MFQWYSLNGTTVYFNDKILQDKGQQRIWMVLCGIDQQKVLVGYESEEHAIHDKNKIFNMELELCDLGFTDVSRHIFTLKYDECLHTFQMMNENVTDCWYSKLSTIVRNSNKCRKESMMKVRERTTSVGMAPIKSLWKRQLTPITLEKSIYFVEPNLKDFRKRSATSDCITSHCTSTSIDFSDDVFNSTMSRSVLRDSSDKSFHTFTEGFFKENDLIYLFDTIRDKANKQINCLKLELLLAQINFLENILYLLTSDDDVYIENRYGEKIQAILKREKEENPTLPIFFKLPNINHYVDNYGFKHSTEENVCKKLICQKLIYDLRLKSQSLNDNVRIMNECINNPSVDVDMILYNINNDSIIGFPAVLRKYMWNILASHHLKKIEFPVKQTNNYFAMLLQQIINIDVDIKRLIKIESYKIYTQNIYFDKIDSTKIRSMQNVMMAIYVRNSLYKYSPLLMKISAMGILILEPAEVFRLLVAISESIIGSVVLNESFSTSFADQMLLKDLLCNEDQDLHNHFLKTNTDINLMTKRWIENIFTDCSPFESSLRIFDMFLIKGQEWIVLLCLVILKQESKKLMRMTKAFDIYKQLNIRYNQLYDVEYILEETRKLEFNFSTDYLKNKRQSFQKMYKFIPTENSDVNSNTDPIRFQDNSTAFRHIPGKIECITSNEEYLFISVARDLNSVVHVLNFSRNFVKENSIKVAFFVSVIKCIKSFILVASDVGVLSLFDFKEKQWLWKMTLQNCPLDMAFIDDCSFIQLYIGLDNGSLAIIEDLSSKNSNCTFHLQLSLWPIYKLTYSDPYLICGTKDNILILDPNTTSILNKIVLSHESNLIIQDMKVDNHYLWLVYKGSTIIELWNIENCTKILSQNIALFQGRRNINGSATLLHPIQGQNQIWIATDTGEMFIYDIKCSMSREVALHNSDLQLNNNTWECHQSVVDKVTDYLCSMSYNQNVNNQRHSSIQESNYTSPFTNSVKRFPKRLSVTMIDNDFVDISILGERSQELMKTNSKIPHVQNKNASLISDSCGFTENIETKQNSVEEIHLKKKTFLSLKGGMKISDSPIQYSCSLTLPSDIGEAFITLSSYMEEENNMVIWKQGAQGWKYKIMQHQSLEKSNNFFTRLLHKINLSLI